MRIAPQQVIGRLWLFVFAIAVNGVIAPPAHAADCQLGERVYYPEEHGWAVRGIINCGGLFGSYNWRTASLQQSQAEVCRNLANYEGYDIVASYQGVPICAHPNSLNAAGEGQPGYCYPVLALTPFCR